MKILNLDWTGASDQGLNKLNVLKEFLLKDYETLAIYKEIIKRYPNQSMEKREFVVADVVFLFNSRLHLFSGNLKSKCTGPFLITKVFLHRAVELGNKEHTWFIINGQRIKIYLGHA